MNRIVIIGNGFDMAHGIDTSYNSFLDYLWEKIIKEVQNSEINTSFKNSEIYIDRVPEKWISGYKFSDFETTLKNNNSGLHFENKFLEQITRKRKLKNWVDIENEYYSLLKETLKLSGDWRITNLNSDFEQIKNHLISYLKERENNFKKTFRNRKFQKKIGNKIFNFFKLKDFTENAINKQAEIEFNKIKKDRKLLLYTKDIDDIRLNNTNHFKTIKDIKRVLRKENANNYFDLVPQYTLLLNFNYTNTNDLYDNSGNFDIIEHENRTNIEKIHIHGILTNTSNNPVIFGFGDELDKDYQLIENLNNNEYLENIKSIKYLETENYKNLLSFINSQDYQVFILGHSCGISDRTLLNTIFEHDNCVSIKPFFHLREDKTDNYSDIIRNISRNFNDKTKMRDRVVNKKYCEPLS